MAIVRFFSIRYISLISIVTQHLNTKSNIGEKQYDADIEHTIKVYSEYKNGTITIKTTYKKVQNGLDPPEGHEYIQKQLTRKYHIDDKFHFVE